MKKTNTQNKAPKLIIVNEDDLEYEYDYDPDNIVVPFVYDIDFHLDLYYSLLSKAIIMTHKEICLIEHIAMHIGVEVATEDNYIYKDLNLIEFIDEFKKYYINDRFKNNLPVDIISIIYKARKSFLDQSLEHIDKMII